ncbi:MAG: threonine aldolase, partial [Pseudonocardiales bacterium]|nr:threonine aldolase [Pseudonocardiales bacterium]
FATEHNISLHLDGARLFNASVAMGVPAVEIARYADSVQFCLSKGLGAPVGSVVAGTTGFIRGVRRVRKMLGGGMRQAGVLAAAGLVALEEHPRLAEDHANARRLAEGLAGIEGISVDLEAVVTNIVFFRVTDERWTWQTFVAAAAERGLAIAELGHGRLRAVTHSGVTSADVDRAVEIVNEILRRQAALLRR